MNAIVTCEKCNRKYFKTEKRPECIWCFIDVINFSVNYIEHILDEIDKVKKK